MSRRPREPLADTVGRKARRKLAARRSGRGEVFFWLGMFGMVGWSVVVPTLLAVALGLWLDRRWPVGFSWTLTLLLLGVVLGCVNAWHWVQRMHDHRFSATREDEDD
ncbi:MAG: AtpZ/AtpI family protein [Candidatus Competibacterales bacterium]|nr:AtpZ/AtpI family protein [Candidatus Competibacterales bacterium]